MTMERWSTIYALVGRARNRWAQGRPERVKARAQRSPQYAVLREGYPEDIEPDEEAWLLHDTSQIRAIQAARDWNWVAALCVVLFLAALGGWYAHKLTWTPPTQVIQWDCEVAFDKATQEREVVACSGEQVAQ